MFTICNVQYLQSVTVLSKSKKQACKEICIPRGKRDTGGNAVHPACEVEAFSIPFLYQNADHKLKLSINL